MKKQNPTRTFLYLSEAHNHLNFLYSIIIFHVKLQLFPFSTFGNKVNHVFVEKKMNQKEPVEMLMTHLFVSDPLGYEYEFMS